MAANSTAPRSGGVIDNLAQADWAKIAQHVFYFFTQPWVEVWHGLRTRRIPLGECVLWADVVGLSILLHLDQLVVRRVGWTALYPVRTIPYYVYCALATTSAFWLWGLFQAGLRPRLINRLTEVFAQAGLKNALGKFPAFISDYPIDEFTRKLGLAEADSRRLSSRRRRPFLRAACKFTSTSFARIASAEPSTSSIRTRRCPS